MKTYKFQLYQNRRNRYLKRSISASASIYNRCIALHKRYYSMFNKHLNKYQLMKHIAKLRKKNSFWQLVGSQAVQDICDRIDRAYLLFFKQFQQGTRPPSFCKSKKYKSFTLKQAGYKLLGSNRIRIGSTVYKFFKLSEEKGHLLLDEVMSVRTSVLQSLSESRIPTPKGAGSMSTNILTFMSLA